MKVVILGQGYVGLSLAVSAAQAGHQVIGFDVNSDLVVQLNLGVSHVEGISNQKLEEIISNRSYQASADAVSLSSAEVIVIAVPTPLTSERNPDLSFIHACIKLIIEYVENPVLVINESTSYPGTLRNEIAARITEVEHLFVSAPERIDPGNNKWNVRNTPRLIGALSIEAAAKAREFYSGFCEEVIDVSSPEVAEAAKIFENTFRQVNIALVNEFTQIADALGISGREVLIAAATKPYGFMEFHPGPGVGGHCIPVDPTYLAHVAKEVGVPATFIERANEVNLAMPSYVVKRVISGAGGFIKGKSVVVVGVSYKANVIDTRETPAVPIINLLRQAGATVVWHDPLVGSWGGEESADLGAYDVAVVVTKHDVVLVADIEKSSYVFDCTGSIPGADGI